MNTPGGLLVLGFGGHARSIADVGLALGIKHFCFIDVNARPNEFFGKFPVLPVWEGKLPANWAVMPASGSNSIRQTQYDWACTQGWPLATLIAPTSTIGYGAKIGEGSFIAQHAHVGPMASLGVGCVINTGAIVEHDCDIGEFTHISVNATVAGKGYVGSFCFVGAGATVIDSVRITEGVTLGAGACAHRDIKEPGTYVGVPAQRLDNK
ncbi:NeuD/PglB/VioB family sugar acetyltransferase [Pseudomonas izuensis]|uniref:NeuD/PglB/VioB family sugar acetyltransferase n=1 Tax=Pseudomonas izuensis TaxID=2684212 RepID=UPI00135C90F3|nr:NeuD/PglB/VioB family sugar acetyltransferase [Pseudomonas izuensis]